jgi:hypothetical protein
LRFGLNKQPRQLGGWRGADGAHDWNRTSDLFLTKEVLYRLSYMSELR